MRLCRSTSTQQEVQNHILILFNCFVLAGSPIPLDNMPLTCQFVSRNSHSNRKWPRFSLSRDIYSGIPFQQQRACPGLLQFRQLECPRLWRGHRRASRQQCWGGFVNFCLSCSDHGWRDSYLRANMRVPWSSESIFVSVWSEMKVQYSLRFTLLLQQGPQSVFLLLPHYTKLFDPDSLPSFVTLFTGFATLSHLSSSLLNFAKLFHPSSLLLSFVTIFTSFATRFNLGSVFPRPAMFGSLRVRFAKLFHSGSVLVDSWRAFSLPAALRTDSVGMCSHCEEGSSMFIDWSDGGREGERVTQCSKTIRGGVFAWKDTLWYAEFGATSVGFWYVSIPCIIEPTLAPIMIPSPR